MVDPENISKTCLNCGYIKKSLKLSERLFHCDFYGVDRDLNAAINIRNKALEKLWRGTPDLCL